MPDRIGKYEIRGQIGRGAMGTVYEGFDAAIGRRVAIKVLRTEVFEPSQLPDLLARFKREAQSAGQLSHPNIVTIFEYGEEAGAPYIVMEYMTGEELGKRMNAGARFALDHVARIMSQLLGALAHAHEHGVVHRDLKPSNMFLLKDGSIKVVDFGIARVESSELTETGAMLGTPAYMSPEQCLGRRVDQRSDLFSAGVILYQLLTGDKPFTGSTTTIIQKVLRMDPLPPSELDPTLSPAWDAVIASAMAKMPEARFQSAQEFADAVRGALGPVARAGRGADATEVSRTVVVPPKAEAPAPKAPEKPAAEPPATPAEQPKRPSRWPAAVIVLLAAGAAGGYFALKRAPQPEPVVQAPAPPAVDAAQVRREVEERLRREYEEKEAARRAAAKAEALKAESERAAAARMAAEREAADRAAAAKLAAQRSAAEKAAARIAAERAAAERAAAERAAARQAADRAAAEKAEAARLADEKAAAASAEAARLAAAKEAQQRDTQEKAAARRALLERLKSPLDGQWVGGTTTGSSFQCPSGEYAIDVAEQAVTGTVQWERTPKKSTVTGVVHHDHKGITIVVDYRSRFLVYLVDGQLVGRDGESCAAGGYQVVLRRR